MVDDQRQNTAIVLFGPVLRQQRQRRAVRPAGNRDGKARGSAKRPQPGHGGGEMPGQPRTGRIRPCYEQCARWLNVSIFDFMPLGGVGNWLLSEESVSHAASFWLMAASELARPNNDCGAQVPVRLRL